MYLLLFFCTCFDIVAVVLHVADKAGDDNPHSRQLKTWKTCWKEMMAQEREVIS